MRLSPPDPQVQPGQRPCPEAYDDSELDLPGAQAGLESTGGSVECHCNTVKKPAAMPSQLVLQGISKQSRQAHAAVRGGHVNIEEVGFVGFQSDYRLPETAWDRHFLQTRPAVTGQLPVIKNAQAFGMIHAGNDFPLAGWPHRNT